MLINLIVIFLIAPIICGQWSPIAQEIHVKLALTEIGLPPNHQSTVFRQCHVGSQCSFKIALDPVWPVEGKPVDKFQIRTIPSLVTATVSEDIENGKKRTKLVIDWENSEDHDHPSKFGYRLPQSASIMKQPRVVFRFAVYDKDGNNKEFYYADISDRLSPNNPIFGRFYAYKVTGESGYEEPGYRIIASITHVCPWNYYGCSCDVHCIATDNRRTNCDENGQLTCNKKFYPKNGWTLRSCTSENLCDKYCDESKLRVYQQCDACGNRVCKWGYQKKMSTVDKNNPTDFECEKRICENTNTPFCHPTYGQCITNEEKVNEYTDSFGSCRCVTDSGILLDQHSCKPNPYSGVHHRDIEHKPKDRHAGGSSVVVSLMLLILNAAVIHVHYGLGF